MGLSLALGLKGRKRRRETGLSVRWSGLKTNFAPGEILVLPKLEPPPRHETLRVLIADDDPMIPVMLSERLQLGLGEESVHLMTVNSGEEALALMFDQPVDVLLTDYDFSQGGLTDAMNGLALLREIRAHRIVVTSIFMTGYGDEEVAKNAILEGAADYLTKPSLKGLVDVVQRCAERHRHRLEEAALRNAARLLEISQALNRKAGQERGAELTIKAIRTEVDCDLVWMRLLHPTQGSEPSQRAGPFSNDNEQPGALC
jgi:CheY-like chemotaxis protein